MASLAINDLFSIVIAVATVIYATLTYWIVREMRASRHQANRPKLVILPPPPLALGMEENKRLDDAFEWWVSPNNPFFQNDEKQDLQRSANLQIGVKNIGTAPAVNVRIATEVFGDELERIIVSRDFFYSRNAKIKADWLSIGKAEYNLMKLPPIELPICVSTPTTNESSQVNLPHTETLRFVINFFFQDQENLASEECKLGFEIRAAYEDLDGNSYSDVFRLTPEIGVINYSKTQKGPFIGLDATARASFRLQNVQKR